MKKIENKTIRRRSIAALVIILPAPSLASWLAMAVVPNTIWAPILFASLKIWMFSFPLIWFILVEGSCPSFSPMRKGGVVSGITTGIIIAALITAVYISIGSWLIDLDMMREMMGRIGLDKLHRYITGAIYWITANSLLEEFVWRWFVVCQARKLMPAWGAIVFSAAGFTIHHIVATSIYFSPLIVGIITLGIFIGGIIWSWLYVRYDSIWPAYISHVIADLAVFIIGYLLIFG